VSDEGVAGAPTDPHTRAYIHVLRALGLHQAEIGDRIGMSQNAVGNALSATAERVRDGEDPLDVYAEVLAPVLTVGPPAEGGAAAGGEGADGDDGRRTARGPSLASTLKAMDPDAVPGSESRDERPAADSDGASSESDPVPDGGLPTRAAVADAIRECHDDGLTHIKMRHICARLDGHERDQTGVAKSVGQTCARFEERGALEQWSGSRGSGRSVWEIADVGALPRPTGRADGGDRSRECHACGAETDQVRCHECNAAGWTDYPVDPDAALARASRLRNAADRLETRAAGRPDGGDGA
jgi:transcriptional regulator with XRE-family HTH domain